MAGYGEAEVGQEAVVPFGDYRVVYCDRYSLGFYVVAVGGGEGYIVLAGLVVEGAPGEGVAGKSCTGREFFGGIGCSCIVGVGYREGEGEELALIG